MNDKKDNINNNINHSDVIETQSQVDNTPYPNFPISSILLLSQAHVKHEHNLSNICSQAEHHIRIIIRRCLDALKLTLITIKTQSQLIIFHLQTMCMYLYFCFIYHPAQSGGYLGYSYVQDI